MNPCRLVLTCLATSIALSLATPSARAEEDAGRALVLWERGIDAVRRGDLGEAVAAFRQSYEARPLGRTACDLGRALRREGQDDEAASWLDRCAADLDVPAADRAAARGEARVLSSRRGALTLRGAADGERLLVDGELAATLPLDEPLSLAQGEHRIEVLDAAGGRRVVTVEVFGGRRRTIDLSIQPEPRSRPDTDRRRVPRWALWTTLALSLATAAGAVVAYAYDLDFSRSSASQDQAGQARLASAILAGVAGAGLAVTLVLIPYLRPRPSAEAEAATPRHRTGATLRLAGIAPWVRF
jgi:hypothetical protein